MNENDDDNDDNDAMVMTETVFRFPKFCAERSTLLQLAVCSTTPELLER